MRESENLSLELEANGSATTLTVRGEIDMATVDSLERARDRAVSDGLSLLVIDLREVAFVDSTGLRFLLQTNRLSQRAGWELQVRRPAKGAMKVFTVTGADRHLPFVD
jgi:anti-anti-sigma factor